MPAVSGWAAGNNQQAGRLLSAFLAAKPSVPSAPMAGTDHPPPQGFLAPVLFAPAVWPADSETGLLNIASELGRQQRFHEDGAEQASASSGEVFSVSWTAGAGANAAEPAYRRMSARKSAQGDASGAARDFVSQAAGDVGRIKRRMAEANSAAHQEAESYLRSPGGTPTAKLAVIATKYRVQIHELSAELHSQVGGDTARFAALGNRYRLAPADSDHKGAAHDHSVEEDRPGKPDPDGEDVSGVMKDHSPTTGGATPVSQGGSLHAHSPESAAPLTPALSSVGSLGSVTSHANPGRGLSGMSMPSLPGLPGSATAPSGGLPLSSLLGMTGTPPSGFSPPPPTSFGADFGRGLVAGASAAGVGGVPAAPVVASPAASLATPTAGGAAPVAAAPAAAPISPLTTPSAPAPSPSTAAPAPSPHPPETAMAPYGSVLPPPAPASAVPASAAGGAPAAPAVPPISGGGGSGPGVPVVVGRNDGGRVGRDETERDMEIARRAVAELAGTAGVEGEGIDWAVAVGRACGGQPTLWVATNEGACYIPRGVHLEKTMLIATADELFDSRWFGWCNPAETAVRAAWARGERGDVVSCVATTWGSPSRMLDEQGVDSDVGVMPARGADFVTRRIHRLQTIDPAIHEQLTAADTSTTMRICRELAHRVAFGMGAEDLHPAAQVVARALASQRVPPAQDWQALEREYDSAKLYLGAMRPGLDGVESPEQTQCYRGVFVMCRRLETLICQAVPDFDPADIVYAALTAGVQIPLLEYA